jgi:hypothetical protein
MTRKLKRQLKKVFSKREESFLDTLVNLSTKATFVVIIVFLGTQLFINSVLTPKGILLEDLSQEKTLLIETNRELGQEIARIRSISIIKEITSETMKLKASTENEVIYISNESIIAGL